VKNFYEEPNRRMEYPRLLIAIRSSGRPQYEIARAAGIREGRLSEVVRRGGAKPAEREAISRALGGHHEDLFEAESARA
jgi:hypothetical protein